MGRLAGTDYPSILAFQLKAIGCGGTWEREVRFCPQRRWRFDLARRDIRVAIEVDGAIWTQGRHTRGTGVENDCEKYNKAAALGWTVLRVTPGMVDDGRALLQIEEVVKCPK
ncbi:MAG: hypothetical protein KGJ86_00130 [Chloroflexota bacterium]|nr:hypothetical protein [Chloroflexota bacterium]